MSMLYTFKVSGAGREDRLEGHLMKGCKELWFWRIGKCQKSLVGFCVFFNSLLVQQKSCILASSRSARTELGEGGDTFSRHRVKEWIQEVWGRCGSSLGIWGQSRGRGRRKERSSKSLHLLSYFSPTIFFFF